MKRKSEISPIGKESLNLKKTYQASLLNFKLMILYGDVFMQERKVKTMDFTGTWHIYEMELWDEDYFDMDVQAYILIEPDNMGYFQFGLVYGDIDGRIVDYADGKRFEFTWEGNDECDHVFGSGWVKIREKDVLEGEFRFHRGDSSSFLARREK